MAFKVSYRGLEALRMFELSLCSQCRDTEVLERSSDGENGVTGAWMRREIFLINLI